MLYQLDIYFKSLFKNKYVYIIVKEIIKKLRFFFYYISFSFIKKNFSK